MRIDVRGSDALQDVILALKASDREVRSAIRAYSKSEMVRPWMDAVADRSGTIPESRVIAQTATVAVSDQNVRVQSAAKGRRLSGGLNPKSDYGPIEFGAADKKVTYRRKGHPVTRRTRAQFKAPNRKGYVFYPAAREMIPRLASLWVQTVVKVYADIFEGRR